MAKPFFNDGRIQQGMSNADYMEKMFAAIEKPNWKGLQGDDKLMMEYTQQNTVKGTKILNNYEVPEALRNLLEAIEEPQIWMVLTELWCWDSGQCLPYIAKYAECNENIDLRILIRDENDDIMAEYLTEEKRSVPKLVAFSEKGEEIFLWGPRPERAMMIFNRERKAGLSKQAIVEKLHLYYDNVGAAAMEKEFTDLLQNLKLGNAA